MSEPVPALVTLHLWRVAPARCPRGAAHGPDRGRVRRTPGCASPSCSARATAARSPSATPTRCAGACWPPGPTREAARGFERRSPSPPRGGRSPSERWRRRPAPGRRARHLERPAARSATPCPRRPTARSPRSPAPGCGRGVAARSGGRSRRSRPTCAASAGLRAAVGIGEAPRRAAGDVQPLGVATRAARVRPPRPGARRSRRPHDPPRAGTPRSCSPASTSSAAPAPSTAGTRWHDASSWSILGPQRLRALHATTCWTSTPRRWTSRRRRPHPAHHPRRPPRARRAARGRRARRADEPRWSASRTATAARPGSGGTTRCARRCDAADRAAGSTAASRSASCTSGPAHQGTGLGRALLAALLDGITDAGTAVLTTPDAETRARRLLPRRRLGGPRARAALPR